MRFKRLALLAGVALLLLITVLPTRALPRAQSTTVWTGYYFANPDLQGEPKFIREDTAIDFAWGNTSPAPNFPADNFSVRWTRWLYLDVPGEWTFIVIADDGARLFIDDQLVLDLWQDQMTTTRAVRLNLTPAFHHIRLEYYERTGNAQVHLHILSAQFPDWRGEYFNNPTLSGAPVFTRNDSAINFNFGAAGPGGGIAADKFSVRWMRSQYFRAGRYRFTARTRDGVRLWVDNQLVIDRWRDQRATTWTGDLTLTAGDHLIRMEYYNATGSGVASLTWSSLAGETETWRGEYFNNSSLTGSAAFTRDDAALNFNWGTTLPGTGITSPNWSARWTTKRAVTLPGYYTVSATADDGVRVWVNDKLLIDEWHDQSPTTYAAMTYLPSGLHEWRVEYYNRGGIATLAVQITPGAVSSPMQLVAPATGDWIVDTASALFVTSERNEVWQSVPNGYGGTAFKLASHRDATDTHWARWYAPVTRSGEYDVSVYIPARIGTTRRARYLIAHAGTYACRTLDQTLYADQWVSLGVYHFNATPDEFVMLSNVTYETATTLVVDAVRFSAR
ncbi:MAG: PA14 domain-containing protein [Anaerolineae bacterium]|nr:PA14 domain-containing protein [Anaerolineae bacterium]